MAHAVDKVACVDAHARSQEMKQANQLRDSRAQLLICRDETCPRLVRADCIDWLAQIDQRIPTVTIDARDPEGRALATVRVIVDGEKAIETRDDPVLRVDPGPHRFRFEHAGSAPIEINLSLDEAEPHQTLAVRFVAARPQTVAGRPPVTTASTAAVGPSPPTATDTPATPTGSFRKRAPFLTGAVTVAALGSLAYFGIRGLQGFDQLRNECSTSCAPSRVSPVRTQLLVADISLATAVIMGGLTAWLIWDNRRPSDSDPITTRVSAALDANSVRLQYSGRF